MHQSVSSVIPEAKKRTQQVGLFPGARSVCKSKAFSATLRNEGLTPSPGSVRKLFRLKYISPVVIGRTTEPRCRHRPGSSQARLIFSASAGVRRTAYMKTFCVTVSGFLRLYVLKSVPVCLDCISLFLYSDCPHHNGTPAVPGQKNARGVHKCRCSQAPIRVVHIETV